MSSNKCRGCSDEYRRLLWLSIGLVYRLACREFLSFINSHDHGNVQQVYVCVRSFCCKFYGFRLSVSQNRQVILGHEAISHNYISSFFPFFFSLVYTGVVELS